MKRIVDSNKTIISTPELVHVGVGLSSEREQAEKKRDLGVTELLDSEKFFFDTNRLEVSPAVLHMERQMVDSDKQLRIMLRRLADVEQKELRSGKEQGIQRTEEEAELSHYTAAALKRQEEKIEKIKAKELTARKDLHTLTGLLNSLEQEIEKDRERIMEKSDDEAGSIIKKIKEKELEKSEKERQLKVKAGEIETWTKKREKHELLRDSYKHFYEDMDVLAKRRAVTAKKSELENMMDSLNAHYEKVKATSLLDVRRRMGANTAINDLLEMSNRELAALEHIPPHLKFEKTDLCYDIFNKIWEMLMDNIAVRKQLNAFTSTLNDQIAKKLLQHGNFDMMRTLPLDSLVNLSSYDLECYTNDTRVLLEVPRTKERKGPYKAKDKVAKSESLRDSTPGDDDTKH